MKKVFSIIILALFLTIPLLAEAMGEVYNWAAGGLVSGATTGFLVGGLPGLVIGAIAGTIVGAVGGSVKTEVDIQADEKKEEAQNIGVIDELQNVTIPGIENDISDNQKALARWQTSYDTRMAEETMTAQKNLDYLKEVWGMKNAELGSLNREGATARVLSQKNKDTVIAYAGEDLELNVDEARKAAEDVYNDPNNFGENGQLTKAGAEKLDLVGSKYGIYEQQLFELSAELLEDRQDTKNTLTANEDALKRSKKKITELTQRNEAIQKRRWW